MRIATIAILSLCNVSALMFAQDKLLSVKVIESKMETPCYQAGGSISCVRVLTVKAIIEGRTFWLQAEDKKDGLLQLGEYRARLLTEHQPAENKFEREYEFVFGSGSREKFLVTGEVGG